MRRQKSAKTPEAGEDMSFSESVRNSAQQIWLAGLGAFSKAQDEGLKVFEALVRQGMSVERRTRADAEASSHGVADTVTRVAEDFGRQASESWDRLEQVFENRVERALKRMGAPTREEIEALAARVDALAAEVARSGKPAKTARPTRTRKAAPATPK